MHFTSSHDCANCIRPCANASGLTACKFVDMLRIATIVALFKLQGFNKCPSHLRESYLSSLEDLK